MLARRIAAVALTAVVSTLLAVSLSHASVKWVTRQIPWAGPGAGGIFQGGGSIDTLGVKRNAADTLMITDEADTNRTGVISTSDWAWEALQQGAAGGLSSGPIITVTGARVNAAMESLYTLVEPCKDGACARMVLAVGTWTTLNLPALTAFGQTTVGFTTWSAGSTATIPYTLRSPATVIYQGRLKVDFDDDAAGTGNLWERPEFRLNVIGDIGGTTPQLNRARIYLTYPQRSQP